MLRGIERDSSQDGSPNQFSTPVIRQNSKHISMRKSHEQMILQEGSHPTNHTDDLRKREGTSLEFPHFDNKQSEKNSFSPVPLFHSPHNGSTSDCAEPTYYDYDSDYWEDERKMLRWQARRSGLTYFGLEELEKHTESLRLSEEERFEYLMRDT
jgi:hypothetical protein